MSPEFPPEMSTRVKIALAVVGLLTFLYSIVIVGQILLWFVLASGAIGLYLVWLLIVAVFRLVAAVERIATAAEVDSGIRDPSETDLEARLRRNSGEDDDASDGPRAAPDADVGDRQDDAPAEGGSDAGAADDRFDEGSASDDSDDAAADDRSGNDPAPEDRPDGD